MIFDFGAPHQTDTASVRLSKATLYHQHDWSIQLFRIAFILAARAPTNKKKTLWRFIYIDDR